MAYCKQCGKQLPDNAMFCPNSGTQVDGTEKSNDGLMDKIRQSVSWEDTETQSVQQASPYIQYQSVVDKQKMAAEAERLRREQAIKEEQDKKELEKKRKEEAKEEQLRLKEKREKQQFDRNVMRIILVLVLIATISVMVLSLFLGGEPINIIDIIEVGTILSPGIIGPGIWLYLLKREEIKRERIKRERKND